MAISGGDVMLWLQLKAMGAIPPRPSVLEIGEANWFGDFDPAKVPGMDTSDPDLFAMGKAFYRAVLDYSRIVSVDLEGTERALKFDLNEPLPHMFYQYGPFDIVINSGTAEHVFDQRRLFQTIHDLTAPGGLMVHSFPIGGCTDHGFYTYSPCLIRDLGRANGYEFLDGGEVETGGDRVVHLAWRKGRDGVFKVPQQSEARGILEGEFRRDRP